MELLRQFRTTHLGHHHIGYQEFDTLTAVFLDHPQGFFTIGRLQHLIAPVPQHRCHHGPHQRLIFRQQHRLLPLVRDMGIDYLGLSLIGFLCYQQVNLEAGSPAWVAADLDVATVLLDYAIAGGQPQTSSLPHSLGGEEGLQRYGL